MMITIHERGKFVRSQSRFFPGVDSPRPRFAFLFRVGHRRGRGPSQAEMLQMVFFDMDLGKL